MGAQNFNCAPKLSQNKSFSPKFRIFGQIFSNRFSDYPTAQNLRRQFNPHCYVTE